jgi:hypothetical protein
VPRSIIDKQGRTHDEGDPAFEQVRIDNLEEQVQELIAAVVELERRVSGADFGTIESPPEAKESPRTRRFAR